MIASVTCLRCGYRWYPHTSRTPIRCANPKCRSPYWNREELVMTWVYWKSESSLWTVGYYAPDGQRETESDHTSPEEAAARVHYLNGGSNTALLEALEHALPLIEYAGDKARASIAQAKEKRDKMTCPKCGDPTVAVVVMV